MTDKRCPACGRLISDPHRPKRICARCGNQIRRYDKWGFNEQGRAEHRVCEDPTSYVREEDRPEPQQSLPEASAEATL